MITSGKKYGSFSCILIIHNDGIVYQLRLNLLCILRFTEVGCRRPFCPAVPATPLWCLSAIVLFSRVPPVCYSRRCKCWIYIGI